MNIDETLELREKLLENIGCLPTKLLISRLLIALKLCPRGRMALCKEKKKTWCQIITKTQLVLHWLDMQIVSFTYS